MISRTIEAGNLVITHCSGRLTIQDAQRSMEELTDLTLPTGEVYEMVVTEEGTELDFHYAEVQFLTQSTRKRFAMYKRGRIAFVGMGDLAYAMCRQLEMQCSGLPVEFQVFRCEHEARQWLSVGCVPQVS